MIRSLRVLVYVALFVGVVSGCREDAAVDAPEMKTPVKVGEVSREAIEALAKTTGTLRAKEQAVLMAEAEGRFVMGKNSAGERLDEGDDVKAGHLIAELKNPELEAQIAVDARKQELADAKRSLGRQEELHEANSASDEMLEQARTAVIHAQYAYDAAEEQLKKLAIRSPVAGKIVRLAEIVDSDRVMPGTEIATVMNYRTIIADVNISNPDYPSVKVGQTVRVENFALKNEAFEGTVTMISPAADPTTRAFKAEITIDNTDEQLRPGMFVKADIIVSRREDAVVVRSELVQTRNNRPVIFVVEDEKAVAREVNVGIETKDAVEIINGIEPGDVLIVENYETLRDGTRVTVSK